MLGLHHWVATVPEDEDGEAGCRGTTLAAAGEGGEEGRLPWPGRRRRRPGPPPPRILGAVAGRFT